MEELRCRYPWPDEKPIDIKPIDHGWFNNPEKIKALKAVIKPEFKILVEIGAWLGQSTRILLDSSNANAVVISIDHWKGSNEHQGNRFAFLPVLYETFIVNMWEHRERLIPIRENSLTGLQVIDVVNLKPDLVLIDASHEYEDILADLEMTYKLFPNARICGDDYNWMAPKDRCFNPSRLPTNDIYYPVRRAVKAFCANHKLKHGSSGQCGFWIIN